jgi:hypothetical protein
MFVRVLHVCCCCCQSSAAGANEGELSVTKARMIRNFALAEVAKGDVLQMANLLHLLPFNAALYTPTGSCGASSSGGNSMKHDKGAAIKLLQQYSTPDGSVCEQRGKKLADAVEALIGAIYLTAASAGLRSQPGSNSSNTSSILHSGVSSVGLAAAAAFCKAVQVLPAGELPC